MRRSITLLCAAVLLCAGCSGDPDKDAADGAGKSSAPSADHGRAVRAAIAATGRTTARIEKKIETGDGTKTYTITVAGGFDLAAEKGRLAVDLPGGAISRLDEIFADGDVYLRGVQGVEDTWGSMPRDKAEGHYMLRAPLNDPEHTLKQVAAMRRVSKLGDEKVNGVPATHYRGMIDHATLTLRLAKSARSKADEMRDLLGSEIPVFADAWVDGEGRAVRVRLSFTSSIKSEVTMTLSDFGKPVTASAPPSSEVVPLTSVKGVLPG
ncbi:LppX_LprAFG lipoprotein [Streptomyces sp. NPDC002187]|uniref:LppX_LprAFG lipoprotein n=1 Tax=Streptomyces sp. NPDC002187 TaxID=3364637 RepID=UPI00368E4584